MVLRRRRRELSQQATVTLGWLALVFGGCLAPPQYVSTVRPNATSTNGNPGAFVAAADASVVAPVSSYRSPQAEPSDGSVSSDNPLEPEHQGACVVPENATLLGTAVPEFVQYLEEIHRRLHPIFADRFLASFDELSTESGVNGSGIKANIELVIEGASGKLLHAVVLQSSGLADFDDAALQSVLGAEPFGSAPAGTRSVDGNVYVQWEFHRASNEACSAYFAHPFLLERAPRCSMQLPKRRALAPFKRLLPDLQPRQVTP